MSLRDVPHTPYVEFPFRIDRVLLRVRIFSKRPFVPMRMRIFPVCFSTSLPRLQRSPHLRERSACAGGKRKFPFFSPIGLLPVTRRAQRQIKTEIGIRVVPRAKWFGLGKGECNVWMGHLIFLKLAFGSKSHFRCLEKKSKFHQKPPCKIGLRSAIRGVFASKMKSSSLNFI